METPRKLKSLAELKTLPALPLGRVYLAVAPFTWGKSPDPVKAVNIAKREFGSRPGFKFLLHDAPASTYIDDMGYSRADTKDLDAGGPAVLVATYRTKPSDIA